jgi:hypothetical protein
MRQRDGAGCRLLEAMFRVVDVICRILALRAYAGQNEAQAE